MQSWEERELARLRPECPGWEIWTVRHIYPRPCYSWHARPAGHPVATIHADSPEELAGAIQAAGIPAGETRPGCDCPRCRRDQGRP